jgi:uncharacterized RDD family membrane protein YckC
METGEELRPGRFSDRLVAYLLDTIPFTAGAVVTVYVWAGPLGRALDDRTLFQIGAAWVGLAVLWQFMGNLSGGTPCHKLMGLRVIGPEGGAPGFGRAFVRTAGWVLGTPLANFGFLVALVHPKTRTLHDLLSGTYVVEDGGRRSNGVLAFLVAVSAAVGLFGLNYWSSMMRPTPEDVAAVGRAREGLEVIAKIQEKYKADHGVFAASAQDLAEGSGDVEVFRRAMLDVFRPVPFYVEAGNRRWRVTGAAKDRRNTRVTREGP